MKKTKWKSKWLNSSAKRRVLSSFLLSSVILFGITNTPLSQAQDDDFFDEGDEFAPPPPPGGFQPPAPPAPTFNDPNTPPGGAPSANSTGAAATNSLANKKVRKSPTKVKFSEAFPEDITNTNFPELIDSFDYPNAEITDVIKAISELTGKNFIVDPGVRGKITIMAPSQVTVAEAYKSFLSALAISGFSIVPAGKFLKIVPSRQAQRDSIEIYSGAYTPNTDQMITRIIQLKHISAADVNKYLRQLTTKDGTLEPYEPTNTIILSDYGSNVERVLKIVQQIDVPTFEETLAVVRIRHAKAADIADLIDQIINKGKSGKGRGGAFTAPVPRFGAPEGSGQKGTTAYSLVIPDERTNSIIVVGNKDGIEKIKTLVRQLDFNIPLDEAGGVFVYYVKYGDAEKIAQTLSGITQGQNRNQNNQGQNQNNPGGFIPPPPPPMGFDGQNRPAEAAGAIFGGEIKVVANKETNSLIITASRQDFSVVRNLLRKIDIPRNQVFVEAVIMEIDISDTKQWGISFFNIDRNSNGIGRAGFAGNSLQSILDPRNDSGGILGFGSGDAFDINIPGAGTTRVTSLVGFLNVLRSNTNANVLSQPQVMALDNQEAEIEVGENVPVGLNNTVGVGGVTQGAIQRENATIKLKLKPFISPTARSVRLELEQTIQQVSSREIKAAQLAQAAIALTKRNVKTNIVVGDGDTAVLGGLMREEETTTVRKVPVLGDIPVLGWLFKFERVDKIKQNLVVFLTPRIIKTKEDHQILTSKKLDQRVEFIRRYGGGRDSYGAKADEIRGGRKEAKTPPSPEPQEVQE